MRAKKGEYIHYPSYTYAAHMRGTRQQKVFKLHTRLGKPMTSEPTPLGVTYTRGSDSTPLGPQSSRKLIPVTDHPPQAWPALASRPSPPGPSLSSLLSTGANRALPQLIGHSTPYVSTPLRGQQDINGQQGQEIVLDLKSCD